MDVEMKTLKEDFVVDLKGTSAGECVCVLVVCLLLESVTGVWSVVSFQLGWGDQGSLRRVALVVLGLVLTLTVGSDWLSAVCVCTAALLVLGVVNSLILSRGTKFDLEVRSTVHRHQQGNKTGFLYVSKLRGCFLLSAAITILAVDFHIFPRRWAKTEIFGTGLMDLGVGTFAMLAGLVWPRSVSKVTIIRRVAVLLLLGIIRLVSVKYVGYNEHVSEYGRHWNFFFTFAAVVLIGACLCRMSSSLRGATMTVFVVALIQHVLLVTWKYEEVCVTNKVDRESSFLLANKEGLLSLVGYVLLWLGGRLLCQLMKVSSIIRCTCLLSWSVFTFLAVHYEYVRVSRRAANLGYVTWTSGCVTLCLLVTFIMDVIINILQDRANYVNKLDCPDAFSIVNRKALFHFLFSNVLTGIINVTVNPFKITTPYSLLILLGYTSLPIVIILSLDVFGGASVFKKSKSC